MSLFACILSILAFFISSLVAVRPHPYYEEILPAETYIVDNSTLIPILSPDKGVALRVTTPFRRQVHSHVNFRFPEYISAGQCLCQIAFRLTSTAGALYNLSVSGELDVFELESPTSETHHPDISGYQGRLSVGGWAPEKGVADVVFGMEPFNCSAMKLGGQLKGYEVAPEWWDEDAEVNVTWSGECSAKEISKMFFMMA